MLGFESEQTVTGPQQSPGCSLTIYALKYTHNESVKTSRYVPSSPPVVILCLAFCLVLENDGGCARVHLNYSILSRRGRAITIYETIGVGTQVPYLVPHYRGLYIENKQFLPDYRRVSIR